MSDRARDLLAVFVLAVGAVCWLALTVFPMDYGPVESAVVAGALVAFGLYEFVLDRAFVAE